MLTCTSDVDLIENINTHSRRFHTCMQLYVNSYLIQITTGRTWSQNPKQGPREWMRQRRKSKLCAHHRLAEVPVGHSNLIYYYCLVRYHRLAVRNYLESLKVGVLAYWEVPVTREHFEFGVPLYRYYDVQLEGGSRSIQQTYESVHDVVIVIFNAVKACRQFSWPDRYSFINLLYLFVRKCGIASAHKPEIPHSGEPRTVLQWMSTTVQ